MLNYSILGYIIYLLFTFTVIVYVGLVCHRNGKVYSLQILSGDEELSNRTNHLLLVCYYLFNLGYCLLTIYTWPMIPDWKSCMNQVVQRAGLILFVLGILHCINIFMIILIAHQQQHSSPTKQIL